MHRIHAGKEAKGRGGARRVLDGVSFRSEAGEAAGAVRGQGILHLQRRGGREAGERKGKAGGNDIRVDLNDVH